MVGLAALSLLYGRTSSRRGAQAHTLGWYDGRIITAPVAPSCASPRSTPAPRPASLLRHSTRAGSSERARTVAVGPQWRQQRRGGGVASAARRGGHWRLWLRAAVFSDAASELVLQALGDREAGARHEVLDALLHDVGSLR